MLETATAYSLVQAVGSGQYPLWCDDGPCTTDAARVPVLQRHLPGPAVRPSFVATYYTSAARGHLRLATRGQGLDIPPDNGWGASGYYVDVITCQTRTHYYYYYYYYYYLGPTVYTAARWSILDSSCQRPPNSV